MTVLGEFGKSLVYKMKSRGSLRYSSRCTFDCRKGTVDGDKGLSVAQIAADIRCNLIRRALCHTESNAFSRSRRISCVCLFLL